MNVYQSTRHVEHFGYLAYWRSKSASAHIKCFVRPSKASPRNTTRYVGTQTLVAQGITCETGILKRINTRNCKLHVLVRALKLAVN